jgi:hypothetical protein
MFVLQLKAFLRMDSTFFNRVFEFIKQRKKSIDPHFEFILFKNNSLEKLYLSIFRSDEFGASLGNLGKFT